MSAEKGLLLVLLLANQQGCMVHVVADAAVSVTATVVKAGVAVTGAAISVAAAGVRAVAGDVEPASAQ